MEFIKVLIVDDHLMVREGLRKILEKEKNIVIVSEAATGEEAVKKAVEYNPNVILLDIGLPDKSGIEVAKAIVAERPNVGVIMLTVYDDDEYVMEAIKAGAMGYLIKDVSAGGLINAINKVFSGESLIDSSVASRLLNNIVKTGKKKDGPQLESPLTKREEQILELIASGNSNRDIAEKLYISERTVKNHMTNIFKKINVHDRTQAAIFAIREGLAKIQ